MAMGIGNVGNPGVIFKRKFRWTLEIQTPCGVVPRHYVKLAARPKLEIEPTEINFLNATTWIPGKGKWQPISVTFLDVASADAIGLMNWIATVYNFQNPVLLPQSEKPGWFGVGLLTAYDGCGKPLEAWVMRSMFPESVDFGDLDYESSDIMTIEMSLRYSDVQYVGLCGPTPVGCCIGC